MACRIMNSYGLWYKTIKVNIRYVAIIIIKDNKYNQLYNIIIGNVSCVCVEI